MADPNDPATWGMHIETKSPLFAEYLVQANRAGWGQLLVHETVEVNDGDCLVVVDMQNDFVPLDAVNRDGGAFGVAEGNVIAPLIVELINHFATRGAIVVATRDYHPKCHCSFLSQDGPFPEHCVQGSPGSFFYQPIGDALHQQRLAGKNIEVAFKGFHEDVDSFGSFQYTNDESTFKRVANRDVKARLHGCSLSAWTGCVLLDMSNIKADINAPPDVLACRRSVELSSCLKKRGIKRIFACGLALDFCVLDTALNGVQAGFSDVSIILDASRAAHLPNLGKIGSGFLSPLDEIQEKMKTSGVKLLPSSSLLPSLQVRNPLGQRRDSIRASFPDQLGPFALVPAKKLVLMLDRVKLQYKALSPVGVIRAFESQGIQPTGAIAPISPVTLDVVSRRKAGIPEDAVEFTWAYPVAGGRFTESQRAYLSTTAPSASFFVFGGFVYLNQAGRIVATMALSLGEGLSFHEPQRWNAAYTTALENRWQAITLPFLREKGVQWFVWLNPGETIKPKNSEHFGGEPWKVGGEHGAFAYLFTQDFSGSDARDCVFFVDGFSPGPSTIGRVGSGEENEDDTLSLIRAKTGLSASDDRSKAKAMALFKQWDMDANGRITYAEVVRSIQRLDPSLDQDQLTALFTAADVNKDGYIDFQEFVKWLFRDKNAKS